MRGFVGTMLALAVASAAASGQVLGPAAGTSPKRAPTVAWPAPIDPQVVQDQDDMTWADYKALPGINWADASHKATVKTIKVALVAADFEDQPFVMTQKKNSDIFGNPQIDPVKREDIAKFYASFWNGQDPLHHGHTVNEYWMEQSHGRIGVSFEAFGPYRMPKKLFQYGLSEYGAARYAPGDEPIDGNLTRDCDALWTADAGQNVRQNFQLVLRIFAGYDETCVWQEFGEMKFQTREDITPEFGNPNPEKPRWAPTRYVPWTSWKAAEMPWSNSAIINGESSGSIVHEVSHAAFSVGDNNNNPFVEPYRRAGAGPWDIMDRGSFNGPGGVHNRWQVPVMYGGAMPAGLLLRQRINFGFASPAQVLTLSRESLAKTGLAVARVVAREVEPGEGQYTGIKVVLDGTPVPLPAGLGTGGGRRGGAGRGAASGPAAAGPGMTQDRAPYVDPATDPLSPGIPNFNNYTLEAVQRMGFDSFCPDSGVLITKNRDQESDNTGPNSFRCFNWLIDAHPEDIKMLDFKRPNGDAVMRTIADYRQLNDAAFHAGLNSGSQYEYEDGPNRLHFYIIDLQKDEQGVMTYTLGVKSLDGSGPQTRGGTLEVLAGAQGTGASNGGIANMQRTVKLTNTGAAGDAAAAHAFDVYRLEVAIEGDNKGWEARLANGLAAVKCGESVNVPVFITRAAGNAGAAKVIVRATSESDAKVVAKTEIELR